MKKLFFTLSLVFIGLFSSIQNVSASPIALTEGAILPRAEVLKISWNFDVTPTDMLDAEPNIVMESGDELVRTFDDYEPPMSIMYDRVVKIGFGDYDTDLTAYRDGPTVFDDYFAFTCEFTETEHCTGSARYIRTDHLTTEQRTISSIDAPGMGFKYEVERPGGPSGFVRFTYDYESTPSGVQPLEHARFPRDMEVLSIGRYSNARISVDGDLLVKNGVIEDSDNHYKYLSETQEYELYYWVIIPERTWTFRDVELAGDTAVTFEYSQHIEEITEDFTLTVDLPIDEPWPFAPIPQPPTPDTALENLLASIGFFNTTGFLTLFFLFNIIMTIIMIWLKMPSILYALGYTLVFALFITLGLLPIWVIVSFSVVIIGFFAVILRQNLFPGGGGL